MKRRALVLTSILISGAAHAESRADELAPDQWPHLLRAAQAIPGFAGLAFVWVDGGKSLVPALTNVKQESKARAFLRGDAFWKNVFQYGGGVSQGYQPAKFSGVQLVQAAQALKKRAPNLTVRVNTTLNRVTVYAPAGVFRPVARAAGVERFVESAYEYERAPRVQFDVQPRTLSLKTVRANPPRNGLLPGVGVRLTNLAGAPVVFHPKCGAVMVIVTRADGAAVPSAPGAICADILETVLIQPGQTVSLPANLHSGLTGLKPGKYLWVIGTSTFPLTLTP